MGFEPRFSGYLVYMLLLFKRIAGGVLRRSAADT